MLTMLIFFAALATVVVSAIDTSKAMDELR